MILHHNPTSGSFLKVSNNIKTKMVSITLCNGMGKSTAHPKLLMDPLPLYDFVPSHIDHLERKKNQFTELYKPF